jgi:DNA polymerase
VVTIIFYDFEVFKYDWLVVILDMAAQKGHVIINDPEQLKAFYEDHKNDIWCGYNSRNYDQFILRAILLDFNPKQVNDWIIVKDKSGWMFSNLFWQISLNNYDVMPNPPIGLKTMEGFMGNNIKESDVPFDIDRKLTPEEIAETVKYCRHDVEQTVEVFLERKDSFDAMLQMCQVFNLPLSYLGKTDAGITAKVLDCVKTDRDDEFDFIIEPFIKLEKYQCVLDWFRNAKDDCIAEMKAAYAEAKPSLKWKYDHTDPEAFRKFFYNRSLTTNICGVPHVDGWGGIHGASEKPIFRKGLILHVDVGSYYPSYLIAHKRITRSARHPEKYAEVYTTRMALKAAGKKKEQAPYKLLLNALSGAMKDKNNGAYDPCMNNTMVVNCQLMLIMLLERLEKIPGFELIQSNTDGLIVQIPDTDEAFNMLDDICYEWETTCSTESCKIGLAFDQVDFIYQKDVNNYLFKFNGADKYERKGAYVKELSRLDADLPIINKALVDYMTKGIHPMTTIKGCDDLIQFQKIVKLSSKYEHVEHNGVRYSYKCYRVFASTRSTDGKILKCRNGSNPAKFGNTPDQCFIVNDNVKDMRCPTHLDKKWYIDLAIKRLSDFGVTL